MADFKLHHLALTIWRDKLIGGMQGVRGLLVILEHEMPADGGHLGRILHSETPASFVDFVDALIADVAIAGVPNPVPVVVEAITGEGLHWRGTGPQIVIDPGRNRFFGCTSD